MTDDPLTVCPNCQGEIRRVVNSVGVVFKGKGFYVTDNRSSSSATLPGASGAKEDKAEKAGGEGKESKSTSESAPKESKAEKPASTPAAT